MKKVKLATPMVVALVMLIVGLLPASASQPGTGSTTVHIMNSDSANDAQVVASFYDEDGNLDSTLNVASLKPYLKKSFGLDSGDLSPALPPTWRGSVVVSSDRLVSASAHTTYVDVPMGAIHDELTAADYLALATPGTESFLPYVFDHKSRSVIFTVQNTDATEATVHIHYISRNLGGELPGGADCSGGHVVDTIPANGVVYYDLYNQTRNGVLDSGAGGTIPCMDPEGNGPQPAAGSAGDNDIDFNGAIYITSTNTVAVGEAVHWTYYAGQTVGATTADDFLFFPQIVRHKKPASVDPAMPWVRWSAFLIQNTGSSPISVTVTLLGAEMTYAWTQDIPAYGALDFNTRFKGSFPDDMIPPFIGGMGGETAPPGSGFPADYCNRIDGPNPDCALEVILERPDWTGAATVEVNTPGGKIVGVAHTIYGENHNFTYEAMGPGSASRIAVCPWVWDKDETGDWRYSNLIIQNASTTAPATVEVYFFDDQASHPNGGLAEADFVMDETWGTGPAPTGSPIVVDPSGHQEINTKWATPVHLGGANNPFNTFPVRPNNWEGGVVVVSLDEDIFAAMSLFKNDTSMADPKDVWSAAYTCYNVPN